MDWQAEISLNGEPVNDVEVAHDALKAVFNDPGIPMPWSYSDPRGTWFIEDPNAPDEDEDPEAADDWGYEDHVYESGGYKVVVPGQ